MSLTNFNYIAKTLQGMHPWFIDIMRHLGNDNYKNGDWTPTITNMAGSPTVTAWYQRFGALCDITIIIDGTHAMSSALITLPENPVDDSTVIVHNFTDNTLIDTSSINGTSNRIVLADYSVTDKKVIIKGSYKVNGI